jgi:nuclear GTP-binding protein
MDDSDASDESDSEGEDEITGRPARPSAPVRTQSAIPIDSPADPLDPLKKVRSSRNRLFTKEELAVLSPSVIDRGKLKQQAKKAKKRQMAQAKTEGELMYGMMGMEVEHQEPVDTSAGFKVSARQLKKDKKRARDARERQLQQAAKASEKGESGGMALDADAEMDQKKEADFAAFLANVGGELSISV